MNQKQKKSPRPQASAGTPQGIDVNQDMEFQRREWRVERFGWAVIAIVIFLALLGLFGKGALSNTSAGDREGNFWLEYERFGRYQEAMSLKVHVLPVTNFSVTTLGFDQNYLEKFKIERVLPEPQKVEKHGQNLRYFFLITQADEPVIIEMLLRPLQSGVLTGHIKNDQAQSLEIRQFVYP